MSRKNKNRSIDMLHGPLLKKMVFFALPIAASSMLQQLFNSTDIAVVGRFAGSEALAAVGSTAPAINLLVSLLVGISVGANVVIANYIGRGEKDKINSAVHTAILLALISGIIVGALGIFVTRGLLELMDSPEDVIDLSTLYMRIIFAGIPFMMLYNFSASILRSKGDTMRPLICLAISGAINIALNLLLVAVFNFGVAGVAIATVTSNAINATMLIIMLRREEDEFKLSFRKLRLSGDQVKRILNIGIPTGLQGMVFSVSNIFVQSAINSFGSSAIAGSAAAVNFEYFSYFVMSAFVQTTVTFTSQNYGARKLKRCRQVFYKSIVMALVCTATLNIIFILFRVEFIGLFTSDEIVKEWAYVRLFHVLVFNLIAISYEISAGAMRGMGHSVLPSVMIVLGSCVFRILWVYFVLPINRTFELLLFVYPASWIVTGIAVTISYFIIRGKEETKLLHRHGV